MSTIAPYPAATIPPSDYYTPTPLPEVAPLAATGTTIDLMLILMIVLALLVGAALIVIGAVLGAGKHAQSHPSEYKKEEDS